MTTNHYLLFLKTIFEKKGDSERAQGQMRYMRNQFEYYGLRAPEWLALLKDIFSEHGIFEGEELKQFVRLCMEDDHREINYAGLEMMQKTLKKQPSDFIHFLEELILTKSWWDTVDWLAKLVGMHFRLFPGLILPVTERWMASENFWLQRVCLIFQLTYKEKTDFDLMCRYILELHRSKEFFIQKGAGWALRQYSKTDPEAVRAFIEAHPELPALTKREGMKSEKLKVKSEKSRDTFHF